MSTSGSNRSIPSGPLFCPELGRALPLDLTVPQDAALVGRAERTMYRLARSGELPTISISGGDLRVATAPLLTMYGLTVARTDVPQFAAAAGS